MCVCSVSEAFRRFLFSCSIGLYHCGGLSAAAPNWMLAVSKSSFNIINTTADCSTLSCSIERMCVFNYLYILYFSSH